MQLLAAASDGGESITKTAIWVYLPVNTIITAAIGWGLRKLSQDQHTIKGMEGRVLNQAMEKIEQQHRDAMRLLDERHELTGKLIDERMRRISHTVDERSQKSMASIDLITARLDGAMEKIESASERFNHQDAQLELKALTQIKDVQIQIARNAVTKEDLKEHERSVQQQLKDLRDEVRRQCSE